MDAVEAWDIWRRYYQQATGERSTLPLSDFARPIQIAWLSTMRDVFALINHDTSQKHHAEVERWREERNKATAEKWRAEQDRDKALKDLKAMTEKYESTRRSLRLSRKTSVAGSYEQINFIRHPMTQEDVFFRRDPEAVGELIFESEEDKVATMEILENTEDAQLIPTNGRRYNSGGRSHKAQ